MICWKMVHASSSGILTSLRTTFCFWRCSRRVRLTPYTPLWGKAVWEFRWSHIVVWCWGVLLVWGCESIARLSQHLPHPQFFICLRFWWRLSRRWGCEPQILLFQKYLFLGFCLNVDKITYDITAYGSSLAGIEFMGAGLHIFVHLSDSLLIILWFLEGI